MSLSGRYLPAVLLAIFSLTVSTFAQSTVKQTSKAPRGSISGRVTIKDKGAPGVVIGIRKSEEFGRVESSQRTTTDQDGFYRITNVAAGSYEIVPSAPGFVTADVRYMWSRSVILGEDENLEDINFALVRGGVVTGRVTDAEGRPVIEQSVSIYPAEAFNQQSERRHISPYNVAQTDDRGIYRIFGLIAGRYKICAGRGDDVYSGPLSSTRATYKQVFHPDVSDPAKATVIEVSEGSEANNVDIRLGLPLQTYSVSGRVIDEKGLPAPNMRFSFQRTAGERLELVNVPATSNASGEFIVEGLIAGKYGVYLFPNQNLEMRAETLSFEIVDQDVSNLTVRLTKGASLTGVVAFESEDKAGLKNFSEVQLRVFVNDARGGGGFGNSKMSPIAPDGSFRFAGLPAGMANIMLGAKVGPFPPKGMSISRIERDGVVVPRPGVEIKEGEQITGLRVVVTYGNGSIRGVVKFENGSLPQGAQVFVQVTKAGEQSSYLRPPPVDGRGQFLIEGLSPGVYRIQASIVVDGPPARTRASNREVTVQDGVATEVVMPIDMSPQN